jgi:hypothetical protein
MGLDEGCLLEVDRAKRGELPWFERGCVSHGKEGVIAFLYQKAAMSRRLPKGASSRGICAKAATQSTARLSFARPFRPMTATTTGGSWFKMLHRPAPRRQAACVESAVRLTRPFWGSFRMRGPKVLLAPAQFELQPLRRRLGLPEGSCSGMRVNQQDGENLSLNMQDASNNFGLQSERSLLLPATCISLFTV